MSEDIDKLLADPEPAKLTPLPTPIQKGNDYAFRRFLGEIAFYLVCFITLYGFVYAVSAGWHDGKRND